MSLSPVYTSHGAYIHLPVQARRGSTLVAAGASDYSVYVFAGESRMSAIAPLYSPKELNDDLYAIWEDEFKPLLGSTARWPGFCYIVKDQLERESVAIVETGTCRKP